MEETPDFQTLANLWLARDSRSEEMDEETRARAVQRLAKALERRRQETDHAEQEIGLVVNIDRDNIIPGKGLAQDAIEQLTEFLRERIDEENGV